jgi:hypothetical protein
MGSGQQITLSSPENPPAVYWMARGNRWKTRISQVAGSSTEYQGFEL